MKFRDYINESVSRHADIFKAKNKKWYLNLANKEYGDYEDSSTYGPFNSEKDADDFMSDNFSNPGGLSIDDSGKQPVPKRAPNGSKIIKPQRGRMY